MLQSFANLVLDKPCFLIGVEPMMSLRGTLCEIRPCFASEAVIAEMHALRGPGPSLAVAHGRPEHALFAQGATVR